MWSPCAGAVDDGVGVDRPTGRLHRPDCVSFDSESGHFGTALDSGARVFRRRRYSAQRAMLIQEAIRCAIAAARDPEITQDGPACRQVVRNHELAWDTELVLQIDLMSQRLKLGIVGGEEEVPDPLQPRVDAESLLELGPIGLAQTRESNVRCRPQLRPETPAAAPVRTSSRGAGVRVVVLERKGARGGELDAKDRRSRLRRSRRVPVGFWAWAC